MRTFLSLCASCLLAGGALAQNANPDNPHDVQNKDRPKTDTPASVTNAQTQQAESANPHSVQNKDAAKPTGNPDFDKAGRDNPDTGAYRNRDKMAGSDSGDMMERMANATPQMQLHKLHMANLKEISMGRLAEQNGSDRVKDYARTLQRDHQDADGKVTALAQRKGFNLTDTPKDPDKQKHMEMEHDRLSSLKGADFDRAFTNMMANEHKRVITLAQTWKQNCKDQDVCALIDTLLPKLQQHQQMAERLRGPAAQGRTPEQR